MGRFVYLLLQGSVGWFFYGIHPGFLWDPSRYWSSIKVRLILSRRIGIKSVRKSVASVGTNMILVKSDRRTPINAKWKRRNDWKKANAPSVFSNAIVSGRLVLWDWASKGVNISSQIFLTSGEKTSWIYFTPSSWLKMRLKENWNNICLLKFCDCPCVLCRTLGPPVVTRKLLLTNAQVTGLRKSAAH